MEACEAWCAKNGHILSDDTFLDEGKSGYTGDHIGPKGQLRRFLDLVEAGLIPQGSYLVVESLDRLSRENVNLALERFLSILNAGVNIVTLMDNEKVYHAHGTAADLIMSVLVMARANEESETKSKRAKDNWNTAFERARTEKKPVGKQVALWLELVEVVVNGIKRKEYRERPDRVEVVQRIFRDCIAGHGFVTVAKRLNGVGGELTPAFRGGTWCATSVQEILENRCVLGEWKWKDKDKEKGGVIEGYFPQVVTMETWELAQQAMVKRKKRGYTKQTNNFQLWQQIGYCAVCGGSMTQVTKGEKLLKYMACSDKRKGLCDDALNIRSERCEQVYKELLVKVGALGLIQTEAAEITKAMTLVDASIHTQQTIRAQHMKKLSENADLEFLYELVATADQNLKRLKAEREELDVKHAAQTAAQSDKAWLLANIPLTERDDRQRANALLGRLGIVVRIRGGATPLFTVYQRERLILELRLVDEVVESVSYNADTTIRMYQQGELEEHQLEINVGFGSKKLPKPLRAGNGQDVS